MVGTPKYGDGNQIPPELSRAENFLNEITPPHPAASKPVLENSEANSTTTTIITRYDPPFPHFGGVCEMESIDIERYTQWSMENYVQSRSPEIPRETVIGIKRNAW